MSVPLASEGMPASPNGLTAEEWRSAFQYSGTGAERIARRLAYIQTLMVFTATCNITSDNEEAYEVAESINDARERLLTYLLLSTDLQDTERPDWTLPNDQASFLIQECTKLGAKYACLKAPCNKAIQVITACTDHHDTAADVMPGGQPPADSSTALSEDENARAPSAPQDTKTIQWRNVVRFLQTGLANEADDEAQ